MPTITDEVWKLASVVEDFLGYRASIPMAQEQISIMLKVLASRSAPITSFLDLGCGDGILGAAVLSRYPNAHGVLADFSEPMLAQAREKLNSDASRLTFTNIDYGDPNWVAAVEADSPFDAIVSGYSIHHQPDSRKQTLYAELFNLLAPGGWFINVEHIAPESSVTRQLFDAHILDVSCAVEQQSGGSRTREQIANSFNNRPDKDANILAPLETQCNWLREIGYADVDCYFRIYELAVFGGKRPL